jgi:trimeric autotransporter adhesin
MNRIYRSVWSESLGAWVAAAETTRARGRRGSVRATVVAAATLLGLAGAANVAWGAQAVNDGTLCMSQSGPGQTWTCHVPNSKGGFAIIKGLPDVGNGSSPDWPTVAAVAAATLGTGALLLGDATTVATGTGSIAIGNGAKSTADNAIAMGTGATASAANGVALGASSVANAVANGVGYVPVGSNAAQQAAIAATTKGTLAPVSVGSTTATRQIMNVAAGTRNSDAVNVAQLRALGTTVAAGATHYYSVRDEGIPGANFDNDGATGSLSLAAGVGASAGGGSSTAVGYLSKASNLAATAVGNSNQATGNTGTAIGSGNLATNSVATAIGGVNNASGSASTALGAFNTASGEGSLAAGYLSEALSDSAVALGRQAKSSADSAIAIGRGTQAAGDRSISVGTANLVNGEGSGAIGNNNTIGTGADNTFVLGNNVNIGNNISGAVALGNGSSVTQADGVALGSRSQATTAAGIVGYDPSTGATAAGGTIIASTKSTLAAVSVGGNGQFRQITNLAAGAADSDAVNVSQLKAVSASAAAGAVHYYSVNDNGTQGGNYDNDGATGVNSLAAGVGALAAGENTVAIGRNASANAGKGNIAIGADASVVDSPFMGIATNATALGAGAVAVGSGSVALGAGARVLVGPIGAQESGIAIGSQATATGFHATAIGRNATATGDQDVVIGDGASSSTLTGGIRNANVVLGMNASMTGNEGVVLGSSASGMGPRTTAIGAGARSAADDAIAIGTGALTMGETSLSIGTGAAVGGARSGSIGNQTGVTADGSYAIGNNNLIDTSGKQSFVLGNNVSVTNANNVVLGNASADQAAVQVTSATVPTVIATLNPDGTVSYSAGPAVTYGNFAGTATGVVSVGAAGAERQIVNVAPGAITATSTDAINGSQLYNAVTTLSGSITTIVNNAQTHYYSVNDGGTKQGNYANDGASGANSVAAGAGASASGAGAVAVGNAATASAANSVAVGSNATASTANSVALGNGSTTTAATPTASTTIQGQTYNFAGANPVGVVSVGAPGAERQIQNVAAGQLSATSTDAVNGSQLYATNQAINNIQGGGGIKYFHANSQAADSQAAGAESVAIGPQAVSQGAGSIAIGNSTIATATNGVALGANATADRAGMSGQKELFSNSVVNSAQGAVSVGSAGNERQINNVAGGTQATDAVNVRQLQAVKNSSVQYDTNVDGTVNHNSITLGNNTGPTTIRNVAPGVAPTDAVNVQQLQGSVANSAAYTDARVNQMGQSIDQIGKKAYAGVAAAMAMESAPYVPGKVTYAAGMGYYEQQSAVGVSLRKTADNGRWSVTGGASATTRGSVGFRVGIGGVWD